MATTYTLPDGDAARLRALIEDMVAARTVPALMNKLRVYMERFGIDVVSYQIVADDLYRVPIDDGLIYDNFPEDWIKHYLDDDLEKIDPILSHARITPAPFHWFDVAEKMRLTREQEIFLAELRAYGLTDGIAVPIFSAIGDMAYFGLGVRRGQLNLSPTQTAEITLACQLTHNRYVLLAAQHPKTMPKLTPREKDVLVQAAFGRSSPEIAEHLGVSVSTVDTLLKRAFKKLDTSSRLVAVLRAIGAGLILP